MYKQDIIKLLESILGKGQERSKGEILFECPLKTHRHSKLSININSGNFQC